MVHHILKDRRKVNSVKGIVIKKDQHPQLYRVVKSIEERGESDRVIQAPARSS